MTLLQRYEHHNLVMGSDGQRRMRQRAWQKVEESEYEKVARWRASMSTSPPMSGPYCERLSKRTHWRFVSPTGRVKWRVGPAFTWSDDDYTPELYEGE